MAKTEVPQNGAALERDTVPETVTIHAGEFAYLEVRAKKLAREKSYLQLVIRLMNKVNAASGLEDTVDCMMRNILDVVGGANIVLYYWIDDQLFSADVFGKKMQLDAIDDELVQRAVETHAAVEIEHDFSDTQMTTPEFGNAYTWVYPLLVGKDLIGIFKMESLNIAMRDLYEQLPTFFNHVALVLKNEILGYTRLKQAYDQLNVMNGKLALEIAEREQAEQELREIKEGLEKQVIEQTTESHRANEQLKMQHVNQDELIQQRTAELLERSRELQDNQRALMNIVDDLNQKTDELEKANAKLMELDQLKSMFIASMSHELRTPLNSIIGFSSIIRDEWLGPVNPEQKDNLDTIQRSGKHLLSLINDVIDVSKIEAGRIEVRLEEFDLYDLVVEAVQYVEKDISEKGLKLHLAIDHRPVCSDRRRLLQCVINLLSNAVKFTEEGEVNVSALFVAAGAVTVSVQDTGIGIAEEDIQQLFKPFVRLTSTLKTIAPGTGLGLYLTRKLVVEVLGGDILCTSDVGKGSTFTLRIPERIHEKSTGSRG